MFRRKLVPESVPSIVDEATSSKEPADIGDIAYLKAAIERTRDAIERRTLSPRDGLASWLDTDGAHIRLQDKPGVTNRYNETVLSQGEDGSWTVTGYEVRPALEDEAPTGRLVRVTRTIPVAVEQPVAFGLQEVCTLHESGELEVVERVQGPFVGDPLSQSDCSVLVEQLNSLLMPRAA